MSGHQRRVVEVYDLLHPDVPDPDERYVVAQKDEDRCRHPACNAIVERPGLCLDCQCNDDERRGLNAWTW